MLQVAIIRQDIIAIKEKLAKKNFASLEIVDEVIKLDDKRKNYIVQTDELKSNINNTSKQVGMHMAKGEKEVAEILKQQVASWKIELQPLEKTLTDAEEMLQAALVQLPNLPSDIVPVGKTPEDNVVVKQAGDMPELMANPLPHWDLVDKYKLIDFELGNKITGSGFPVYKGKGAKLQRALIQFFLDHNVTAGYEEHGVPLMVNEASAYGTGQLPDKEGQMYHATEDNLYLIPTSEVPLTNIYRDVIVKENDLPIRLTGYTPCFRREAGSYGKDVRGLNRLHQFDKVEIVQVTTPEQSYATLDAMVSHVELLLKALALPYRILRLCGGDMSFASALTYDFEVYSAAQQKWLEVSSVSNFETFQSNRLKLRFKNTEGKTQLCHTLNGSSLALPRIMAALLENNQTHVGIRIPEVLHSYMGTEMIVA
jgi:seryl-tRNA synthetase